MTTTPGRIYSGLDIDKDVVLRPDVCVVGSGAGGAMVASRLARAGASVVVLEEGGHYTRKDFHMREDEAFPSLYQDRGNRATTDLSMMVLQARAVGGGTLVNWTTSYRTPDDVVRRWQERDGAAFSPADLKPHFEEVEKRLNVTKQTYEDTNPNNRSLYDGCKKMGWDVDTTSRNVKGCMKTGYCGTGCPIDAKQGASLTYLPDAIEAGASLYADVRALRIEWSGKRASAVHGAVIDRVTHKPTGRSVRVEPKVVVVSGGALNSPALLMRSELTHGPVGQFTWLHPVTAVAAVYAHPVEPFYGAPQSVASHHFAHRPDKPGAMGFFLEASPGQPMLASIAMPGFGAAMRDHMLLLNRAAFSIVLAIDGFHDEERGGTVKLKPDGLPRLDYAYTERLYEAFRSGMKALVQLHLANGAEEALTVHTEPLRFRRGDDLAALDRAPLGTNQFGCFTAHQMGGCRLGKDPARSVVSPELRHHVVENLFVADGSVFPTSLGVNPMESIYGVTSWASQHILKAAKA